MGGCGFPQEELDDLATLTDANIQFACQNYVQVIVQKTSFRRASVRIQWREEYPHQRPIIELRSPTLTDQVLDKIEIALWKQWDQHDPSQRTLKMLFAFVHQAITKNKLLYAKEEIDRIQMLLTGSRDRLQANVKRGTVLIDRTVGAYRSKIKITLPDLYPTEPVNFQYLEGTF